MNGISECENLRSENSVKSAEFPQWLFWLLVSSVVKAVEVTGKWIALAAWLVPVVSDFLSCFQLPLCISALPVSGLGETKVDFLCSASKAGVAHGLPWSSFPHEGNSFWLKSSLLVLSVPAQRIG